MAGSESSQRPRWWLVALLGLAIVAYVASVYWPAPSAGTAPPTSNGRRPAAPAGGVVEPADLEVRLGALDDPGAVLAEGPRNPFRFQPVAPSAPPSMDGAPPAPPPMVPSVPPLKFIGVLERGNLKIAALSDCRNTFQAMEGQTVDGRYRLVRIGIESIVMEYLDGSGRTTIRLEGCSSR